MAMSRSLGFASVTTRSPMVISPSVTSSRPAIIRRIVVLPQPDGPTSTTNSPFPISSETSRTACTPPGNSLLTCSRTILPTWHLLEGSILGAGEALVGEGGPQPAGGLGGRAEPVEAEQGRPDHRRRGHLPEGGSGGDRGDPGADTVQEDRIVALEQTTAEDDVGVPVGEPEAADRRGHHGDDLLHLPPDDLRGGPVASLGGREHQRRQLQHPLLIDPPEVDRLHYGERRGQPEVPGYQPLQCRPRPAAVLAAQRGADSGHTDQVAASPVARERTEGGEARLGAVRRDAGAVHAGPDHHGNPPGALGPRTQHSEDVVAQEVLARPPAPGDLRRKDRVVGREVEAGQAPDPELGEWAVGGVPARVAIGRSDHRLERLHRALDPERLV